MSSPANLESVKTLSRDELVATQLERLKWTLNHAYHNVSFYKKSFAEHGVHPDDLRSLEDLAKFPFTTKKDLRDHYPFGLFAVPMDNIVRIHASSGTTGKPTVVGYTKGDIDTWANLTARSISAAGGRPSDKIHVSYGYGLFTGGLGAHYGAERLGAAVIPMSGGQTEKQVQLIRDFQPDIIMVTPSYMLNIADEMEHQGMTARDCSLRIGIFGAEPWTHSMRREIEERMGLDATDIYGLSEIMGPGVAQEFLETKDGPTIWEDSFLPEIIDPVTGEVVADGQEGELVFTTLAKEGLPMIRYRTRDLTRLLPGSACIMRRMAKITGRSDDMLIIRGVNVFPTQIEELVCNSPQLAPHYIIEVYREGHMDSVDVLVEPRSGITFEEQEAAAKQLQHDIKSYIGISTHVKPVDIGAIVRSEGKAKRVIDKRPKE